MMGSVLKAQPNDENEYAAFYKTHEWLFEEVEKLELHARHFLRILQFLPVPQVTGRGNASDGG
jgi:hypothetical protein